MNPPDQSVFEFVAVRRPEEGLPGLAHLSWRAGEGRGMALQVYVDGLLYDAAADIAVGQMWLHLDDRRTVRLELLAVDPAQQWTDYSDRLAGWDPPFAIRAAVALVRDEALPIDSRVVIGVDGQDRLRTALWGAMDPRGGFGGLFGIGRFGDERATSPGFGLAELGAGPFGSDADGWRWRCDDLPAGPHTLTARIETPSGQTVGQLPAPQNIQIDPPITSAQRARLEADGVLRWE